MIDPLRRRRRRRAGDERGASSVELVLYMPLLLFVIFLAVQVTLVYLGNQAASSVARETARIARAGGSQQEVVARGRAYADNISNGILNDYEIRVEPVGDDQVRVTVSGEAQKISPIGVPRVSETVLGPLERFVEAP